MPDRKRAAQFMPFNGLRGYAEQVTAAQIRRAARREITEDRTRALNDALLELEKATPSPSPILQEMATPAPIPPSSKSIPSIGDFAQKTVLSASRICGMWCASERNS